MNFYFAEETDNETIILTGKGGLKEIPRPFKPYCFQYGPGEYKDMRHHKPMEKVEFDTMAQMREVTTKGTWHERDVPYIRRMMLDMDWKIGDVPKCYIDIETDDSHGGTPNMIRDPIVSIGVIFEDGSRKFLHGDEEEILKEFYHITKDMGAMVTYNGGSDVWETRSFDMPYIATRWGLMVEGMKPKSEALKHPYDRLMRHCTFFDIYQIYKYETSRIGKSLAGGMSLDNVAHHELGYGKVPRTKRIKDHTIAELEEYNMRDVEVLRDLDQKFSFVDMKIGLARLCNVPMVSWHKNRKLNELKPLILVDQLMLAEARRLGMVLPARAYLPKPEIVGAMVLDPKVGLHHGVQNFDVKQMYPSIMVNERVSPDADRVLIPNIINRLRKMRAEFKAAYEESKSLEDYIMQYNYKVLSNVFYGAFGNVACRLFDAELAGYITKKGRSILGDLKQFCEACKYPVLYGDTDSVFVKIEKSKVKEFEDLLNMHIKPYEVESGEYYDSILYLGDDQGGKKKRYGGITEDGIKLAGLESVRRDYSPLARRVQTHVLEMILGGSKLFEVEAYVRQVRDQMYRGELDEELVISRGVKSFEEYSYKEGHRGLPHVRALKKAIDSGYQNMFDIQFVFDHDDVFPIMEEGDLAKARINYDYYWKRQIKAVTDPLMISVRVGNGEKVLKERYKKTVNRSMLDYISS